MPDPWPSSTSRRSAGSAPSTPCVVWSRTPERIARSATPWRSATPPTAPLRSSVVVAPDIRGVVEAADVLCTLTPAREPVVHGEWFHPGLHVNAVGAPPRPDHREIDSIGMARATVVVDNTDVQLQKSGEVLLLAARRRHHRAALPLRAGSRPRRTRPGRTGPDQITLFNSVGLALQDLAFAALAIGRAGHPTPVPTSATGHLTATSSMSR